MASYGETHFNIIGFVLVLGAAASGGLRWALTQLFFRTCENKLTAVELLYAISPAGVLALLPAVIFVELPTLLASPFVSSGR